MGCLCRHPPALSGGHLWDPLFDGCHRFLRSTLSDVGRCCLLEWPALPVLSADIVRRSAVSGGLCLLAMVVCLFDDRMSLGVSLGRRRLSVRPTTGPSIRPLPIRRPDAVRPAVGRWLSLSEPAFVSGGRRSSSLLEPVADDYLSTLWIPTAPLPYLSFLHLLHSTLHSRD